MNDLEFYINKYSYVYENDNIDLSFVPMMLRRKLSPLNKYAFYTLNNCFDENIENIIYSSKNGELDKLNSLIKQYKSDNEVSPSMFSNSVHNSTMGLFSLFKKYNNKYTALAACENTFSMGLLNAITDNSSDKLYCYADKTNKVSSISIYLSKNIKKNISQKYKLKICNNNIKTENEAEDFIHFLKGECNIIQYSIFQIERVQND
ncbi:beta-ketoacyl synthase chain length factor [bacterium]|nr:beta-ketoacyl synthase chain length factor [bacterium]